MRYINKIIITSTQTPAGHDITVAELRALETATSSGRGLRYVSCHYLVRQDGTVERGRPASQPATSTRGSNAHAIDVAYVGGLDADQRSSDTRTRAQTQALIQLVGRLMSMYRCRVYSAEELGKTPAPAGFLASKTYARLFAQLVLNKLKALRSQQ